MQDTLFGTLGGLALFLYGMGLLSDGLKLAAGDRLRNMLAKATRWPLMAMLIGTGVTCLIQSSSATSVIVVGLINAGLLTLKQGISVILGANIGTTITGWLVAAVAGLKYLKISTYAMPFIAIGFVLQVLGRKPSMKTLGQILLGFGLLFLGLHLMKDAFGDLTDKQNSPFVGVLKMIGDQPALAVLAGAAFTMIIQSSSASIAMVIVLAINGGFGSDPAEALRIAIPFVLGDNIGTTITAQLAALRTNISGKRAAMAHTLFNVIGVAIVLPLVYLRLYPQFVQWTVTRLSPLHLTLATLGAHVAAAHSIFNVAAACVVLPVVGLLEKLVLIILPTRAVHLEQMPVTLERHLLNTPSLAIDQTRAEIIRMSRAAKQALDLAVTAITKDNQAALNRVSQKEDSVDQFQSEITRYLVELSQRTLEPSMSNELPVLFHTVNDFERISDHAVNIAEIAQRKMDQRKSFSDGARREGGRMRVELAHMFDNVILAVEQSDIEAAQKALAHEAAINRMQITYRNNHLERMSTGVCDPMAGLIFIDFVNNMEKIGDHLANIAQGVIGGSQWLPTPEGKADFPTGTDKHLAAQSVAGDAEAPVKEETAPPS